MKRAWLHFVVQINLGWSMLSSIHFNLSLILDCTPKQHFGHLKNKNKTKPLASIGSSNFIVCIMKALTVGAGLQMLEIILNWPVAGHTIADIQPAFTHHALHVKPRLTVV